jgi:hypothetical protein
MAKAVTAISEHSFFIFTLRYLFGLSIPCVYEAAQGGRPGVRLSRAVPAFAPGRSLGAFSGSVRSKGPGSGCMSHLDPMGEWLIS